MMEEESWVYLDETFSSDENFSDSDKVDSETEAELYSLIHYEGNLSSLNCHSSTTENDSELDATSFLSDKTKYVLSTERKVYNGETKFADNSINSLQNSIKELIQTEHFDKALSDNSLLRTLHEKETAISGHKVPSNFVNDSNSDQLAEIQSSDYNNKRKLDNSVSNYSSPPKKAATDSRRNTIRADVDSSGSRNIHTNMFCEEEDEDIIFISSDSENDHSSPSKKRIPLHQNMSMPNIKIGENHKDLWFVNQEDISRARNIKSRRYHDKVDVTCSNCNRKGHHSRICPLPKSIKCFICGGKHIGSACINRICGKCYRTGHDSRSCRMSFVCTCSLCNMKGHIEKNCPDLWRRYHLTTQPGKVVPDKKVKQNSFIFCCNCGRPGHFGAVCNFEYRGYKNCPPTWPNVLSYDEPHSLPVHTPKTTGKKQKSEKKDSVIKQTKKILNEDAKQARKERIKNQKQKRKLLKRQEFLNSNEICKVLKEKDFPRTPKNNSAVNLSSPRTQKNNNSEINLLSPRTKKNNSTINPFSPRALRDDSVIILPTPKTKKNISVVDLTNSKTPKNNSVMGLISPKKSKKNSVSNDSIYFPESVRMLMLAQARRRERNRKRRIKRRQNIKERKQSQNIST